MKSNYSPKRVNAITEKANFLGYELKDLSSQYPYCDRKCKTYGLIDRRNEILACAYSQLEDIEKYLAEKSK